MKRWISSTVARAALAVLAVLAALTSARPACAQLQLGKTAQVVDVNSDVERYLRVLQLTGAVPVYQWTVRELGRREIRRLVPADTAHPWSARTRLDTTFASFAVIAPSARAIENTTFPYGFNEGPVWAGRGMTVAVSGGVLGHFGPLSFVVDPTVFRAQNQSFSLAPNGQTGRLAFADQESPVTIDRPQRFGNGAYQRFDLGQSAIRLELPFGAVGFSNADQHWGPAIEHPMLLGNNAAGFPHVYVGTPGSLDLKVFRVDARYEAGRLDNSPYSPATDSVARRLITAVVASIVPFGFHDVEFGAARFFHFAWPTDGFPRSKLVRPVSGIFGNGRNDSENQLATFFFRAAFPRAGIEVFGEYGREDRVQDRRDLVLEPDHISAYSLGLQKAWAKSANVTYVAHGELINTAVGHLELVRPQVPFYTHSVFVDGHTERGQALGSAAAYGGGGWNLAIDRYDRTGMLTVAWDRINRSQGLSLPPDPRTEDVFHSLSVKRLRFGRRADLQLGAVLTEEFNRDFTHNATNVRMEIGTRVHW